MGGCVLDNWSAITTMAGRTLAPRSPGQLDVSRYAYDRALRIARMVERLAARLTADERPEHVDLTRVAALYSCVGSNGDSGGHTAGGGADDGAELAADQLPAYLPPGDVDLVVRVLGEFRSRTTRLPEARLLADAVGLEDLGLVGLWNQTRAFHAAGKTLEQLVRLWKTQSEYGYWESRLRDSFHFDTTRKVAQERLKHLAAVYERMEREMLGEDV